MNYTHMKNQGFGGNVQFQRFIGQMVSTSTCKIQNWFFGLIRLLLRCPSIDAAMCPCMLLEVMKVRAAQKAAEQTTRESSGAARPRLFTHLRQLPPRRHLPSLALPAHLFPLSPHQACRAYTGPFPLVPCQTVCAVAFKPFVSASLI